MEGVLFPLSSRKVEPGLTNNLMKILICNDDPRLLSKLMERPMAAHHVVIPCLQDRDLVRTVAATEPHIVVLGGSKVGAGFKALEKRLRQAGFQVPVLFLPDERPEELSVKDLEERVARMTNPAQALAVDSQSYEVITERAFEQNRSTTNSSVVHGAHEEAKLLTLLDRGRTHQNRARSYLSLCDASRAKYEQDWATAALFSGPEAYMWRAQLFRYVGVLAHYVPGVDVDCLPLPKPASPKVEFLHTALPIEAFYALCALREFGINKVLDCGLWEVGQVEAGQTANVVDVARLAGWTLIIRQAAIAHLAVMDSCLSKEAYRLSGIEAAGSANQDWTCFVHFWGFKSLGSTAEHLQRIVEEFRGGRRAAGMREFLSFYNFIDNLHKVETDTSRNN